jgi:hypothetical protein
MGSEFRGQKTRNTGNTRNTRNTRERGHHTAPRSYKRFMDEQESGPKNEAGKDLVRAIFGTDAIAKDTLR